MISHHRQSSVLSRILLLAGAMLALATPGCGSSGGSGGTGGASGMGEAKGTGGGGGSNLDAKADTQVPTSTGGALGTPDSGVDLAAPGTGGTGGTVMLDAGIDMTSSSPDAGRMWPWKRPRQTGRSQTSPRSRTAAVHLRSRHSMSGSPRRVRRAARLQALHAATRCLPCTPSRGRKTTPWLRPGISCRTTLHWAARP